VNELDFGEEINYILYNYYIRKNWDGEDLLRAVRSENIIIGESLHN
jgi:hypothetical protein